MSQTRSSPSPRTLLPLLLLPPALLVPLPPPPAPFPPQDRADPDLARALREIRAIRGADAIVVARVRAVHASPGVWCGIAVTWQEVSWRIVQAVDGRVPRDEVLVRHLLVHGSKLVAPHAPFLRPELLWTGARAILCLNRDGDAWRTADEDFGVRLLDGEKAGDPNHAEVLQAVLSAPDLLRFLHVERPERVPVCMLLDHTVPLPLSLTCAGQPVEFVPAELAGSRVHVRVDELAIDDGGARVRIAVSGEGALGVLALVRRDGVWAVADSHFVER